MAPRNGMDVKEWQSRARKLRAAGWSVTMIAHALHHSESAIRCALDPEIARRANERKKLSHRKIMDRDPDHPPPTWVPAHEVDLWRAVVGKVGVHNAAAFLQRHLSPRVRIRGRPRPDEIPEARE